MFSFKKGCVGCNSKGVAPRICNRYGRCTCKTQFSGTFCDVCKANVEEEDGKACSKCKDGIVGKSFPDCDQSKYTAILSIISLLHQDFPIECDCDKNGSKNLVCDWHGDCECFGNYKGSKCAECADGYYDTNQKCIGM